MLTSGVCRLYTAAGSATASTGAAGSVKAKTAPPPASGSSSQTRPACASMIPRTMARPNPVPSVADDPRHHRLACAWGDLDLDGGALRRIAVCVGEKVVEHLAEPVPVGNRL